MAHNPYDPIQTHQVRMEIDLAPLPFPIPTGTSRIGGVFRVPAEEPYIWARTRPAASKERVLEMLVRGMEAIVRSTEDKIRAEWSMESRVAKARREFEEQCQRRFQHTFVMEALGPLRPLSAMERKLKVQEDHDDWPILGEVLG